MTFVAVGLYLTGAVLMHWLLDLVDTRSHRSEFWARACGTAAWPFVVVMIACKQKL